MARVIAVGCIVLLAVLMAGCSASKSDGAPIDVKGRVVVIGNEPFATIAVEALNGTVYRIEAEAAILQKFRSIQGTTVQVHGRLRTEPLGPAVILDSYDIQ